MPIRSQAPRVKHITGILYPDQEWLEWTLQAIVPLWGEVERISEPYPFDHTDYYAEINPNLFRRFISFKGLQPADLLVKWKTDACRIESDSGPMRKINLDPGYINGARMVLASTKDHAHRIYINNGIFAEVTMRYRFKKWVSFDYTFPDFSSGIYDEFFTSVRNDWLKDSQEGGPLNDQ